MMTTEISSMAFLVLFLDLQRGNNARLQRRCQTFQRRTPIESIHPSFVHEKHIARSLHHTRLWSRRSPV
uniref:Putative secreted protein n=1 Tax=Anopheles darlingi TaxID=43151 RepID=A0A2M4DBT3_ANODA